MSSSLRLLLNAVVIFPSWLQPEHTHPGQTWNMTTFFKLSLSTWLLPSSITLVQLIWLILNFLIHFHCYQTAFCFEIRAVLDLFWRFPNSGCVWLNKVDSITQHMIVHISDHIDKTSWGKKRETTPAEGKTKRPGVHGDESLSSQKQPVEIHMYLTKRWGFLV